MIALLAWTTTLALPQAGVPPASPVSVCEVILNPTRYVGAVITLRGKDNVGSHGRYMTPWECQLPDKWGGVIRVDIGVDLADAASLEAHLFALKQMTAQGKDRTGSFVSVVEGTLVKVRTDSVGAKQKPYVSYTLVLTKHHLSQFVEAPKKAHLTGSAVKASTAYLLRVADRAPGSQGRQGGS